MPSLLSALSSELVAAGIVLLLPLWGGCSVLEDRSNCPCILDVDLSAIDRCSLDGMLVAVVSRGEVQVDTVSLSDLESDIYRIHVPKGEVGISVVAGADNLSRRGELNIPPGRECPPVMMWSGMVDASEEYAVARPLLHKNYCRIYIQFKGDSSAWRGSSVAISGNVSGYDWSGRLLEGDFRVEGAPDEGGRCSFLLPRQEDSSLVLSLSCGGAALRYFAIGNYLASSGYDWSAEDLEDIEVEVDYASVRIELEPSGDGSSRSMEILI